MDTNYKILSVFPTVFLFLSVAVEVEEGEGGISSNVIANNPFLSFRNVSMNAK